jgi:hypothetical protein
MRFLIDAKATKAAPDSYIAGQLLTPLTRYALGEHAFAIDNGAFSGFDAGGFVRLLERCRPALSRCLFVACPDVVGSARRTLECFAHWQYEMVGWPLALVAQDGIENLDIPWQCMSAVFIGGTTDWKMSTAAADVIKAAQIIGKHVHVGRINTVKRFRHFERLGANTCDGSGIARFSWMLEKIRNGYDDDATYLPGCDPVCQIAEGARALGNTDELGQAREGELV